MSDHITDPNMPSDLRALAARVAAGEDPDEIKGIEELWMYRVDRDEKAIGRSQEQFFEYIRTRTARVEEIISIAKDLVSLWESPNIQALPRSDRNAAIETTRESMIGAVHRLGECERKHGKR